MWFNIDLIIVAFFLIVNFAGGFGIRKKESNLSDFKTYSVGNFKNPSVLFLTASMASYIISGGYFLAIIQQAYNTGVAHILKEGLFTPLALVIMGLLVFPLYKNTKKGGLTINNG